MVSNRAYFEQPEGAASVLKHALIKAYLPVFVGKTGSQAQNRRVYFIDGYAGPGRHTNGATGSPLLAIEIAKALERLGRELRCVFVEKNPNYVGELQALLDNQATGLTSTVLGGDIADHLQTLLPQTAGAPLFCLLDPFGVAVAHEHVVAVLNRAGRGQTWPPTEVLLNFSASGVWRIGGKLAAGIDDPKTYARLDSACGGDWWRAEFLEGRAHDTPAQAARHVALAYQRRTAEMTGSSAWLVDVRRRPTHEPIYYLLHFTRHPAGQWAFGNALSIAQAAWRRAWPLEDRAALDAREVAAGKMSLFDLGDMMDDTTFEARLEAEWVDIIAANITRLLERGQAFRPIDKQVEVFGTTLGLARDKHVRAAVKRLYRAGQTATNGVGDVDQMLIVPANGSRIVPLPAVITRGETSAVVTSSIESA